MENKVCESQETMILRAFESRAEGLKYLRTLPLEEKDCPFQKLDCKLHGDFW